jgi:hypothetical protein
MEEKIMPNMNINASAIKKVNPSIVKMGFTIKAYDKDVSKAVDSLNTIRKETRKKLYLVDSLIKDSYNQSNIDVVPLYKNVKSKKMEKGVEKEVIDKVFDKYMSTSTITFTLNNDDTVVDDFTNILNMAIALETKCDYTFDITDEERGAYIEELTAQAIDDGMRSVRTIVSKSTELADLVPKITDIETTPRNSDIYESSRRCGAAKFMNADAGFEEYEQIITPELVFDIFANKKITLSVLLTLTIDLRSSRAI